MKEWFPLALACGLTAGMLAVLVFGFVWFLRRAMARQREIGRHWDALAGPAGLVLDPVSNRRGTTPRTMRGERHGVPVEATWMLRSTSGRAARTILLTCVRARIEPSLRLGLRMTADVAAQSLTGALLNELILEDVRVGIPDLDAMFRIATRDPARVRVLLDAGGTDALRGFVAGASHGWVTVIDDTMVQIARVGVLQDPASLSAALDVVARLAFALLQARRAVPLLDWEQQLASSWGRHAAARVGLALDPGTLALDGVRGAPPVRLRAWTDATDAGWNTVLDARFPASLGVGLRVHTEIALADVARLIGMIDLKTGDGAFDVRFIVQGHDEATVRRVLGEPVRAALLGLARRAKQIELDDRGLRVLATGVLSDPAHLEAALGEVESTARQLLGVPAAPFR